MMKYMTMNAVCLIVLITTLLVVYGNSNNSISSYNIEISPSIEFEVGWPQTIVIFLFIMCVIFTKHLHWCFIPFIIFVSGQLFYSTWLLFDKQEYIKDQLEISWEIAYIEDPTILRQLQDQWHCQGFFSLYDRPVLMMKEVIHGNCYPILSDNFGSTIYLWGIKLWFFKLVQLVALGFFYMVYINYDNNESSTDLEKCPVTTTWTEEEEEEAISECIPINNEKEENLFHKQ